MITRPTDDSDTRLIHAAQEVMRERFDAKRERHTVAASILTRAGQVISAVNVFANCGYGPCAEAVALGLAATQGVKDLVKVVAIGGPDQNFPILSPCGNCRQLLFEYAPDIEVIVEHNGKPVVTNIGALLPFSYKMES